MIEKIFFITAMMLNIETGEITPKYQQMVYFFERINCENYIQQNWSSLDKGFKMYMNMNNINGKLQSMGCTGLTMKEIEELELELDIDDDEDTLST